MHELLAQMRQQPWFLDLIERLARTPIDHVLLFALGATVVRVGFHFYITRRERATPLPIPYWLCGLVLAIGAAALFAFGLTMLAALLGLLAVMLFAGATKVYAFDLPVFLHDLADALVYAGILVFLLIRPYALQTFRIPSESMVPTLLVGDLLIVNKAVYRYSEPAAGDIVVFKPPAIAREPGSDPNIDFVKRLVGTPGQLLEMKNGELYRDGIKLSEPYLNRPDERGFHASEFKLIEYPPGSGQIIPIVRDAGGNPPIGFSLYTDKVAPADAVKVWDYPAQKVPAGKYLMMGDNRDGSFDGRYWGLVERRSIVGKAWLTFWPFNRFGGSDKRP
jgi:signal peptidase I